MNDLAKRRWVFLNVLRVGGLGIMAFGLYLWRIGIGGAPDELLGKVLFLFGLFEALLLPAILRRRWRSTETGDK